MKDLLSFKRLQSKMTTEKNIVKITCLQEEKKKMFTLEEPEKDSLELAVFAESHKG